MTHTKPHKKMDTPDEDREMEELNAIIAREDEELDVLRRIVEDEEAEMDELRAIIEAEDEETASE